MVLPLTTVMGKTVENCALIFFEFCAFNLSFKIGLCTTVWLLLVLRMIRGKKINEVCQEGAMYYEK